MNLSSEFYDALVQYINNDIETPLQLTVEARMILSMICHTTHLSKNLAAETKEDSGQFTAGCNGVYESVRGRLI